MPLRITVVAFCLSLFLTSAAVADEQPLLAMNLAPIEDWRPAWVFVDAFKHARDWLPQEVSNEATWDTGLPLDLTDERWIASLAPNQAAAAIIGIHNGHPYPAGKYTLLYDGEGDFHFRLAAKIVEKAPGRMIVNVDFSKYDMILCRLIKTNPENPVRNIRFIMPGFEKTYATQPFHPKYLDMLRSYPVLRFMEWQRVNSNKCQEWTDRTTLNTFSQARGRGVAVEHCVAISNEIGAAPWLCVPHLASDDYVRQMATLVRDTLKPDAKVYVEYSNEVWNTVFRQTQYCMERGKALRLSSDGYKAGLRYYSQRSVEVFKIWEDVFGGTARLVRVLASQHVDVYKGMEVITWKSAYKHADAFATAPYFGHRYGSPEPGGGDVTIKMTVDQLVEACVEDVDHVNKLTAANVKLTKQYGLDLIAYEGGQHLVGVGPWQHDKTVTKLFVEANRHPKMRDLYVRLLKGWHDAGGGTFAVFNDITSFSKFGCWGMFESQDQPLEKSPKYLGIRDYLKAYGPK